MLISVDLIKIFSKDMEPSDMISNLLSQLNVSQSGKCAYFNNYSTSQDTLSELCRLFGVDPDGDNITAIVSYAALTQILQHVTGMAVSFGSIDFNGNDIQQQIKSFNPLDF